MLTLSASALMKLAMSSGSTNGEGGDEKRERERGNRERDEEVQGGEEEVGEEEQTWEREERKWGAGI